MPDANDTQVGGTHYQSYYQPWDLTYDLFGGDFLLGNCNKYITRWRFKAGLVDLRKARHYIEKALEMQDAGRMPHRIVKSKETIGVIVEHYGTANKLAFDEVIALRALALDDFEGALLEVQRMIDNEERRVAALL